MEDEIFQRVRLRQAVLGELDAWGETDDVDQQTIRLARRIKSRLDARGYITVLDFDGKVLAHGQFENLIDQSPADTKDPDGKFFVRERVELARQQTPFWQSYKFMNPITKKIEPKQMYCERLSETMVCGGVYSP